MFFNSDLICRYRVQQIRLFLYSRDLSTVCNVILFEGGCQILLHFSEVVLKAFLNVRLEVNHIIPDIIDEFLHEEAIINIMGAISKDVKWN
jgi:hypothetical protein